MSLREFAKDELELLGNDKEFNESVLKIIDAFSEMGHSGSSAYYTVVLLTKLLKYEPLTPLTGEEDEWYEVADGKLLQNKRYSVVFKSIDPEDEWFRKAYTITGKIFSKDEVSWYTNYESRVEISFPYTIKDPERVIIGEENE